jgi:hypothetical protein
MKTITNVGSRMLPLNLTPSRGEFLRPRYAIIVDDALIACDDVQAGIASGELEVADAVVAVAVGPVEATVAPTPAHGVLSRKIATKKEA